MQRLHRDRGAHRWAGGSRRDGARRGADHHRGDRGPPGGVRRLRHLGHRLPPLRERPGHSPEARALEPFLERSEGLPGALEPFLEPSSPSWSAWKAFLEPSSPSWSARKAVSRKAVSRTWMVGERPLCEHAGGRLSSHRDRRLPDFECLLGRVAEPSFSRNFPFRRTFLFAEPS